ncbi:Uncharacterised protein [Vibrio cholerae]|uniref:Uncharacterized protein n=1 Tax=Vibrio cholerae TaxID=666 RepID=A0A655ZGU0_VIBCL|nr:Uncharacterised protein [Vibrio cholerae]
MRERRQQFVRGLGFVEHFTRHRFATHAALAFINTVEVSVRHPCTVEVDVFAIQRLFNELSVVQQAIVSRVGDHRVAWCARPRGVCHFLCNHFTAEFVLWNTTKNAVSVTGWTEVNWRYIRHHH